LLLYTGHNVITTYQNCSYTGSNILALQANKLL